MKLTQHGISMMVDRRRCAPVVSPFVIAFAVSIAGTASSSELADLSGLIGGLERGCQLTELLGAFRSDLNARYSFEVGSNRRRKEVRIPKMFSKAIGRANAYNRGDYTILNVSLLGSYRGLHTRSVTFKIGHSNGINVTILTFDAARSKVEKIIGSDVAETQKQFEIDPEDKDFGFSARIDDVPRGSALICDIST